MSTRTGRLPRTALAMLQRRGNDFLRSSSARAAIRIRRRPAAPSPRRRPPAGSAGRIPRRSRSAVRAAGCLRLSGVESRLVTEALIEVSGVRKSCVTESSSADFSRSPSREASVLPSSSMARGSLEGDGDQGAQRFQRLPGKQPARKCPGCRSRARPCARARSRGCGSRRSSGSSRAVACFISSSLKWLPPPER